MVCILGNRRFQIMLVLAIVVFLMPVRLKSRSVIVARTPMVIPAGGKVAYSKEYYRKYEKLIMQASEEFDVPAPLIAAVIHAESQFDPYAVSEAGAMGLMQLMPGTWEDLGGIGSPFNVGHNIKMGTKYLRDLLDQFEGDLGLTIAAYNAGPGAVRKYKRIPPYRETRRYVPKVLAFYRKFRKFG